MLRWASNFRYSHYLGLCGNAEFQPVMLEHLRKLDAARRQFTLLVEPSRVTMDV